MRCHESSDLRRRHRRPVGGSAIDPPRVGNVTVLERAPSPRQQGYMIDFFGVGYDAAGAMGLLPRLKELSYAVDEASLIDEHGRRRALVQYSGMARAVNGRLMEILRPDLELALREQVEPLVDLRYGTSVEAVTDSATGVTVALTDGRILEADLLVGADGIHSTVRKIVFGPEDRYFRYLGYHTAAFIFTDPPIRDLVRNRFCLTDTIDRQIGFYGLRDGRVATFALHRTADPTLPADRRQAVQDAYGSMGWLVPTAVAQCSPSDEIYYDQVAQIEMPRWSSGRVVLLGDACHAVSLLAGQGAALAIAGAYVLGEQLANIVPIEEALGRYQRLMQPTVTQVQQFARRGASWFLPASTTQLRLRRVALRIAALPGPNRLFATALVGRSSTTIEELNGSHQCRMDQR